MPIDHVNKTFVPAYFIAGSDDTFILPHHAEELWKAYAGVDKIYEVIADADHNSQRPRTFLKKVADFLRAALQCETLMIAANETAPLRPSGQPSGIRPQEGPPGSTLDKLDAEARTAVAANV